MDQRGDMGQASSIHIPQTKGNVLCLVASVMLYFIQINVLFGVQSYKDAKLHLKIFIDVCLPFDIAHITQESIQFCLFLFFLMGQVVLWLISLPAGSIMSWDKLTKDFLDRYFPLSWIL